MSKLRIICSALLVMSFALTASAAQKFKRVQTQFIAALADPTAKSGDNAADWGLWIEDPGPRGVKLRNFSSLESNGGVAPASWKFDRSRWWLEENGLIMEAPPQSLAAGTYVVTGDREVMTTLTVSAKGSDGKQRWELGNGATLYDVTHLKCRSAVYTPEAGKNCSPAHANSVHFPVMPGAAMPEVPGCLKQDYAVLFVVGVAE